MYKKRTNRSKHTKSEYCINTVDCISHSIWGTLIISEKEQSIYLNNRNKLRKNDIKIEN